MFEKLLHKATEENKSTYCLSWREANQLLVLPPHSESQILHSLLFKRLICTETHNSQTTCWIGNSQAYKLIILFLFFSTLLFARSDTNSQPRLKIQYRTLIPNNHISSYNIL